MKELPRVCRLCTSGSIDEYTAVIALLHAILPDGVAGVNLHEVVNSGFSGSESAGSVCRSPKSELGIGTRSTVKRMSRRKTVLICAAKPKKRPPLVTLVSAFSGTKITAHENRITCIAHAGISARPGATSARRNNRNAPQARYTWTNLYS